MKRLIVAFLLLFPFLAYAGVNVIPLPNGVASTGSFTSGDCLQFSNSGSSGAIVSDTGSACGSGGGGLPSIAAYSTLSNNTNASAVPTATQQFLLGTPGYATSGYNFAQWTANSNNFAQISLQNTNSGSNASSDFVVTADDGSDTVHYSDFGMNNSNGATTPFTSAHATYLYSVDNEFDLAALGASGTIKLYTTGGVAGPVLAATISSSQGLAVVGSLSASNFSGSSSGTNTGDQIVPANTTGTASNWFSAYNSATGAFTKSQPAFTDISGTVGSAQLPNPSASTLGGIESLAAVTSKWINQISTSGVPSATQPAFTDISGSVSSTQLPNPSSTTLGGIESYAAVSNQWINAISTSGVPSSTQPATTNLSDISTFNLSTSGSLATSNAPALSAAAINGTGTLRTGGTGTTTFPYFYINQGASAPTTWSSSGTHIGVNSASGFGGNFIDFHLNGAGSLFSVNSVGTVTLSGNISAVNGNATILGGGSYAFNSRSKLSSASDGVMELSNNAGTAFTRLQLGGTTSSFPAIKVNSANLNFRLADDSADTGITSSTLGMSGLMTKYNNVTTAGWGVPAIYGANRATAQTGANASIGTYTVGAADGSFIVSENINVTASTTHSFTGIIVYTDETNTSRTLTLNFSQITGTLLTTITNVQGIGAYEGVPLHIRAKAATSITCETTGTFTSVTYNADCLITQMQ